mmetsp:Transcript_49582/g.160281  ORF Transcript_49582/g.160281 Transcript_49582/m.160281 type:complete len:266 (+) Transcript_49582:695-1492(+)
MVESIMRGDCHHLLEQERLRLMQESRRAFRRRDLSRSNRSGQVALHSLAPLEALGLDARLLLECPALVPVCRILLEISLSLRLLLLELRHRNLHLVGRCREAFQLALNAHLLSSFPHLRWQIFIVFLELAVVEHQPVAHRAGSSTAARRRPWCRRWCAAAVAAGCGSRSRARRRARGHAGSRLLGVEVRSEVALGCGQGTRKVSFIQPGVAAAEQGRLHGSPRNRILSLHQHRILLLGRALWRGTWRLAVALHEACSGTVCAGSA